MEDLRRLVAETERRQDDARAFAELLTENAILVNAVGRRVVGRATIEAVMREALKTPLVDVRTRHEFVGATLLREDVAIVSFTKHVSAPAGASVATGSTVTSTLVAVREGGDWRIAVAHNTLVRS